MNWTYTESDPALMLFTAAKERFGLDCAPDAQILELGCAETNFLERLQAQNPSLQLTGVDCYPQPRANVIAGDACDPDLFPDDTFDAIVLLGALEHFGLGFYGDPLHDDGDMIATKNLARWLKPGGWVYFDVPCNPVGEIKENRH
jgi:SAM-dependent methyltransferase